MPDDKPAQPQPFPGQMMPGMPGQMMPGQMMPGQMMPGQMMPGMAGNPMLGMMQMMQMMMGGGVAMPQVDPSAVPFAVQQAGPDNDPGLDAEFIRPALLTNRVKDQQAIVTGTALDYLCLSDDCTTSLGGLPRGCTIAFAGPPGKGKTRSALVALMRIAAAGERVALVVAEEGFHDEVESGRDDLCSRMVKIGMASTGMNEAELAEMALPNVWVLESQYHRGHSWDDFVTRYRYLVEREQIRFVVIDSLNMLDPTKNHTADNLSALKTYNHEKGITCLCIGQVRDTGSPVGGEALMHTADAVFLIEELTLTSKDMAASWGGNYRDRIDTVRAVKSVTTPTFPHPIRIAQVPVSGHIVPHDSQPEEFPVLPLPADA